MATKKQTTTPESTTPADLQIPVPAVAKTTKKAASSKKAPAAKPAETLVAASETPAKAAPAKKKAATPKAAAAADSSALTKVYGQIQASNGKYFIEKGSVPEGQLLLELPKDNQLSARVPSYSGQFVTVVGEFSKKKKADGSSTFVLRNITSHDEIGRRAYELSQENPSDVENNWFKAENELLSL